MHIKNYKKDWISCAEFPFPERAEKCSIANNFLICHRIQFLTSILHYIKFHYFLEFYVFQNLNGSNLTFFFSFSLSVFRTFWSPSTSLWRRRLRCPWGPAWTLSRWCRWLRRVAGAGVDVSRFQPFEGDPVFQLLPVSVYPEVEFECPFCSLYHLVWSGIFRG